MTRKYASDNKMFFIIDTFIILCLILLLMTIPANLFYCYFEPANKNLNNIGFSLFFVCLTLGFFGLIVPLIIEYKNKSIGFKNIFLIIFIVLFMSNLIAVCSMPSVVNVQDKVNVTITPLIRFYGIVYGLGFSILPFLVFYVAPKINKKNNITTIVLSLNTILFIVSIIYSLATEWDKYINYECICSFMAGKCYSHYLIFTAIGFVVLKFLTNHNRWLLGLIPTTILLIFAQSKITILFYFIFLLYLVILYCIYLSKKSRKNTYVILLVFGFISVCFILFIPLFVFSNSGILLKIKNAFGSLIENASATFNSRTIIWQSSFALLTPLNYVFGFGQALYYKFVDLSYRNNPNFPSFEEHTNSLYNAHNAFVGSLGQGGIIFVLINICLYSFIIYASVKCYKKHKYISLITIYSVVVMLGLGLFEQLSFLTNMGVLAIPMFVWPILSIFYKEYSNDKLIKFIELRK